MYSRFLLCLQQVILSHHIPSHTSFLSLSLFLCGRFCYRTFLTSEILLPEFSDVGHSAAGLFSFWTNELHSLSFLILLSFLVIFTIALPWPSVDILFKTNIMIGVSSTLVSFGCQKFSAVGYGLPLLVVPASMATTTMLGSVIQERILYSPE